MRRSTLAWVGWMAVVCGGGQVLTDPAPAGRAEGVTQSAQRGTATEAVVGSAPPVRLAALLLGGSGTQSRPAGADGRAHSTIEDLLHAGRIPYDVRDVPLDVQTVVHDGRVWYSVVVVPCRAQPLDAVTLASLRTLTARYGVGVVAAASAPDAALMRLLGVRVAAVGDRANLGAPQLTLDKTWAAEEGLPRVVWPWELQPRLRPSVWDVVVALTGIAVIVLTAARVRTSLRAGSRCRHVGRRLCVLTALTVVGLVGAAWFARSMQLRRFSGVRTYQHRMREWRSESQAGVLRWAPVRAAPLPGTAVLARWGDAKGPPAVLRSWTGNGVNTYFAFDVEGALSQPCALHQVVRRVLASSSQGGFCYEDLAGIMALRIDDPGSSAKAVYEDVSFPEMTRQDWESVCAVLRRYSARLTVGYVSGWMDGGAHHPEILEVSGRPLRDRQAGRVYDSRDIVYTKLVGGVTPLRSDLTAECKTIAECARAGIVDVECHGYTHFDLDRSAWASSPDRYTNHLWSRELYHVRGNRDCSPAQQRKALEASCARLTGWFGRPPAVLIPPGNVVSHDTARIASRLGFVMIAAREVTTLTERPYINRALPCHGAGTEPDARYVDSGYPLVWYFHDFDIVQRRPEWLDQELSSWQAVGVRQFITLRDLAFQLLIRIEAWRRTNGIDIEATIPGVDSLLAERELLSTTLAVRVGDDVSVAGVEFRGCNGALSPGDKQTGNCLVRLTWAPRSCVAHVRLTLTPRVSLADEGRACSGPTGRARTDLSSG
jgi:peptidoglycan/xylan/chitin deacetylase (PgdA/CDA1 family)